MKSSKLTVPLSRKARASLFHHVLGGGDHSNPLLGDSWLHGSDSTRLSMEIVFLASIPYDLWDGWVGGD